MRIEPTGRLKWQIDRLLESLIDRDVRVAAQAFSPTRWTGERLPHLMPVRDLFLPDNSRPDGLPVLFEGRLRQFERQVGVVTVCLDPPSTPDAVNDGTLLFRGRIVVILRGPAVVQLTHPFHVERLPADPENYWRDLRAPRVQFNLPLDSLGTGHPSDKDSTQNPQAVVTSRPCGSSESGPLD